MPVTKRTRTEREATRASAAKRAVLTLKLGELAALGQVLAEGMARMVGVCRGVNAGEDEAAFRHRVLTVVGRRKTIRKALRGMEQVLTELEEAHES